MKQTTQQGGRSLISNEEFSFHPLQKEFMKYEEDGA